MKRTIIIITVILLAILALYFLLLRQYAGNSDLPVSPQITGTNVVNIKDFAFSPQTLTVSTGATVTWDNQDSTYHQIKSASFSSAPLAETETFSHTFTQAGTYDYSCAIHPAMQGTIVVK